MPVIYESYTDLDNLAKIHKCIEDYLKGNKTQEYYCQKHDVNYHAFKRYWSKYKNQNKEEMKKLKLKLTDKKNKQDANIFRTYKSDDISDHKSEVKSVTKSVQKKSDLPPLSKSKEEVIDIKKGSKILSAGSFFYDVKKAAQDD